MDRNALNRETYDRIARSWHADHHKDDWWVEGVDQFAKLLPPNASILDAGCGAGTKSKYLSAKGLKVTGIDFSQGLLDIAKEEVPSAQFRLLDLYHLDELTEQFDAVFCQAVLLHIPKADVPAILASLLRKVKPGGYLYVAVKETKEGQPEEALIKESDYGYGYERFFSFFSLEELEKDLSNAGLDIVYKERHPFRNTVWLQMIGKRSA